MLKVENVTKYYDNFRAVHDLSFEIEEGEIFGLLGVNGAGKTTTFRMIMGLLDMSEGNITLDGKKINYKVTDKIGFLTEERSLLPSKTVYEQAVYYGVLKGINGGMIKAFARPPYPGNYHPGAGAIVFEADESDKSLLEFHPDYAVILNIGTDHYSKDELQEMFAEFANQAQKGAVLSGEVYDLLRDKLRSDLPIATFGTTRSDCTVTDYRSMNGESFAGFNDQNLRKLNIIAPLRIPSVDEA